MTPIRINDHSQKSLPVFLHYIHITFVNRIEPGLIYCITYMETKTPAKAHVVREWPTCGVPIRLIYEGMFASV